MHLGWELGGWLRGLGAQAEPRTGGTTQKCTPSALGGLGAVARGILEDSFPEDFRLEGLKA